MSAGDQFVIVPAYVIDEAPEAISVYSAIRRYANYDTGKCFPSITTVAATLGLNRRTVERRIARLVAIGAMEKASGQATGTSNHYRFPAGRIQAEGATPESQGGTTRVSQGVRHQSRTNEEPLNDLEKEGLERTIAAVSEADEWESDIDGSDADTITHLVTVKGITAEALPALKATMRREMPKATFTPPALKKYHKRLTRSETAPPVHVPMDPESCTLHASYQPGELCRGCDTTVELAEVTG